MDNQHKKIKGYRDLSQEEIDLMNEIKVKAEEVGDLVQKIQDNMQKDIIASEGSHCVVEEVYDAKRWAAFAKEDLQVGFMKLVRAIARPDSF